MKAGVRGLAAVGSLLVCASGASAQQTARIPQGQSAPMPAPGSLSVPRPNLIPPPPASLRMPQPLTRSMPVPSRGGPPAPGPQPGIDGFILGNPNLWYGAYFPYVPKQPRRHSGAYSPYVPRLSRFPEGAYSPYVPRLSRWSQQAPPVMPGSLQLNTMPGTAQIYVDGFYVGIVDDFGSGGRRLNLDPGPHRILLRASGYRDLTFDVFVEPGRAIVYQGDMEALPAAPPSRVVPPAPPGAAVLPGTAASPRTMYVIPNCYAGDIPPAGALPAGCNIRDMRARRLN